MLQPFRTLPPWEFKDYLGWMEQGDGKLAYGIYVQVSVGGDGSSWAAKAMLMRVAGFREGLEAAGNGRKQPVAGRVS